MGSRMRVSVLRGVPRDDFPEAAIEAARKRLETRPSGSKWSDYIYEPTPTRYVASLSDGILTMADDAWALAEGLSRRYARPWMELRSQEGDHWDFTLYRAGEVVADFSTRVAAFEYERESRRAVSRGLGQSPAGRPRRRESVRR